MQLNMTTDYAFRTLICLFRAEEGSIVRAEDIASEMQIPINYLQRVIGVLKSGGYIETVRGQHGGYRLAWKARHLTAWDIMNMYEPEKIHRSLESDQANSLVQGTNIYPINTLFEIIQEQMDLTLKKTTLQELAALDKADDVYRMLTEGEATA